MNEIFAEMKARIGAIALCGLFWFWWIFGR